MASNILIDVDNLDKIANDIDPKTFSRSKMNKLSALDGKNKKYNNDKPAKFIDTDKPERLIEIEKIIDKYFNDGDNDEKLIMVNKMKDKYKKELEGYTYIGDFSKLKNDDEIKYVSRRNYKISGVASIVGNVTDNSGKLVYILAKTKVARVNKKISDLKSFIFKRDGNIANIDINIDVNINTINLKN